MVVPHYTYLVLKMPGPHGIIILKGSFELSDLCDKEFHKMAQNFGMIANYGESKGKVGSATTGITKQLEGHPVSWEFRDSSHGEAYRRGSTMVTMGPARDRAYRDTPVYPVSGPSRLEVNPYFLPASY
jgi:hypothetical protein